MRRNKGGITICDTLVFVEIFRRRPDFYGIRGVASPPVKRFPQDFLIVLGEFKEQLEITDCDFKWDQCGNFFCAYVNEYGYCVDACARQ